MNSKSGRLALKVAVIYIITASCWILFSDELVGLLVTNPKERTDLSIIKGWVFVLLTGFLLYRLIKSLLARWSKEVDEHIARIKEQQEQVKIFRELFQVMPDAVFMLDVNTQKILDANPAAEKMYGYTRTEFLTKRSTDISAQPEQTQRVIAAGEKAIVPLRWHRRKNGEVFPLELTTDTFEFQGRQIHVSVIRVSPNEDRWKKSCGNNRRLSIRCSTGCPTSSSSKI